MSTTLAPHIVEILTAPVYGSLGTIRFTHTNKRAKYRNLQRNASMSFMVSYPGDPYRYVELRGSLVEAIPDPTGQFYVQLSTRYGNVNPSPPADSPDRVILVMGIDKVIDG